MAHSHSKLLLLLHLRITEKEHGLGMFCAFEKPWFVAPPVRSNFPPVRHGVWTQYNGMFVNYSYSIRFCVVSTPLSDIGYRLQAIVWQIMKAMMLNQPYLCYDYVNTDYVSRLHKPICCLGDFWSWRIGKPNVGKIKSERFHENSSKIREDWLVEWISPKLRNAIIIMELYAHDSLIFFGATWLAVNRERTMSWVQ